MMVKKALPATITTMSIDNSDIDMTLTPILLGRFASSKEVIAVSLVLLIILRIV